jgi:predicted nucleotidyltransferase
LALFGSCARGEGDTESDIDILVEFNGRASFDQYMDLKFLLGDPLGRSVDLVTDQARWPQLRPCIEKEAIRVA